MRTDKLDLSSPDLVNQNIEKIAALFPNCVTETAEGKAIDFDLLKQELNHEVVEGVKERYRLEWPGKKEAIVTANLPTTKTLRPVREDSVDFDNTENIYIEGDNLEVLKILQESYLGKIKMIYIDPPYNTGKDFVYKDNFTQDSAEYKEETNQIDEYGNRLVANPETAGRYHSDWLSMMYPRLKLARNLLTDDGVIFMSIDDNEVHNLRKIADEIFGESNFVAEIIREAIRGGSQSKNIRVSHDYVLVYSKNISNISFTGYEKEGIVLNLEDENGKYAKGRELNKWGAGSRREDSPSMYFPIKGPEGVEVFPIRNDGSEGRWRLGKEKMNKRVADGDVIFEKRENGSFIVYEKIRDNTPKIKQFTSLFMKNYLNSKGTEEIKKLFNIERSYFDYVKPIELMYDLLLMSNPDDGDIVLDFFSGSSSTAQSVIEFNNDFDKTVKFIMAQLPEKTPEDSEAKKANFESIPEIAKARIKRLKSKLKNDKIDYGFKVFKVASSNMQEVYYKPQDYNQGQLEVFADNIKEDRTSEDLLTQILLDWGLPLTLKTQKETVLGKEVFVVDTNYLLACFDTELDEEFAKAIAKHQPLRFVCKDSSFKDDTAKENVKQLLKQLSPNTEMKVI
ncbi:MAG: site-specific DNA-methyltransferase [Mesoflavibacter sp.]|nr:site-specific DNA-methyltransferase [Mesoflavibacter sp.]